VKLSEPMLALLSRCGVRPVLFARFATAKALRRRRLARYNDQGRLEITQAGRDLIAVAEAAAEERAARRFARLRRQRLVDALAQAAAGF
jgi:hypothetical protein